MPDTPRPFIVYTGQAGNTTEFQYPFDVLGTFSAVFVWIQIDGADVEPRLIIPGLDYTNDPETKTITLLEEVGSPFDIGIYRYTNRSRKAAFLGGQTLTATNLNNDPDRLTSVTQELQWGIGQWVTEDGATPVSPFMSKNMQETHWRAEGLPIRNGAPGISVNDFVTLGQAIGLVGDTTPSFFDDAVVFSSIGDGVTQRWVLVGAPSGTYRRETLIVHVASVFQSVVADDNGEYTYDVYNVQDEEHTHHAAWVQFQIDGDQEALPSGYHEDPELFFQTPPANGAPFEARFMFGISQTVLPEDSVGTDQIKSQSIRIPFHIKPVTPSSEQWRGLRFNQAGIPSLSPMLAEWIQGFNARVRAENRINQLSDPNANINFNGFRGINVANPTAGHHTANRAYVDLAVAPVSNALSAKAEYAFLPGNTNIPESDFTDWFNTDFPAGTVFLTMNKSPWFISGQTVFSTTTTNNISRTLFMGTSGSGETLTVRRRRSGTQWQIQFRANTAFTAGSYHVSFVGVL